jgi:arylsulfatase A-like enzyme
MLDRARCSALLAAAGTLAFGGQLHADADVAARIANEDSFRRPNIVLILADDLGFTDVSSYGSEIRTPNIDRLAESGVKFSNYHTSASCAPSRAMILTGVNNHLAGVPNIPEALPGEQRGYDNYDGVLNSEVATVAERLGDSGYHTYMTGKWHLGKTEERLPYNRGFDRTLAMMDTGADNWQHRPYLPVYEDAHWTRDGKEIRLDEPFYSSELLVDEMIGFIDSNLDDDQPFFSFLSFLAVHVPVQAPAEFTAEYLDTYGNGWEHLRTPRHQRAMEIGLVPAGSERVTHEFIDDWDGLSAEEQAFAARRMAVYGGMASAMDHHIGRLLDHLEDTGHLDNTVVIFTSDNGPETLVVPDRVMAGQGYRNEFETLGEVGSMTYIGPNFANAAASPLSYFKFYMGEGGMRVPLIISGPGVESQGGFVDAAAHVLDITPTILSLAGVDATGDRFGGRRVHAITGKDLTPILSGAADEVYEPSDYVGYEVGGNAALFSDGYKIVLNRAPLGDGEWYLYDIINDPGETTDLKASNPARLQHMLNIYQRYAEENGVQPVPAHYTQQAEINHQNLLGGIGDSLVTMLLTLITLGAFGLFALQRHRLMRK